MRCVRCRVGVSLPGTSVSGQRAAMPCEPGLVPEAVAHQRSAVSLSADLCPGSCSARGVGRTAPDTVASRSQRSLLETRSSRRPVVRSPASHTRDLSP